MSDQAQGGKVRSDRAKEVQRSGRGSRPAQAGAGRPEELAAALQRAIGNAALNELIAGRGAPMPPSLRGEMEQRFGYDFSAVRMHDNPRAADLAKGLSAKAFTVGEHIVFSAGQFMPDTRDGKRLLAHELAHVVQQSRGGVAQPTLDGSGSLESAAEQAAGALAANSGGAVSVSGASAAGPAAQPEEKAREEARKAALEQISRMDKEEQEADKDDEPATRTGPRPITLSSLPANYVPNAFTDEQIYRPTATQPVSETILHGEKQAYRRLFLNSINKLNDTSRKIQMLDPDFRAEAASLDLEWDEKTEKFVRDPKIDKEELDLRHNYAGYDAAYREAETNILKHAPVEKQSRLERFANGVAGAIAAIPEAVIDAGAKVVDMSTQGAAAVGAATGWYDIGYTTWSSTSQQYEHGVSRSALRDQAISQAVDTVVPIVPMARNAIAAAGGDYEALGSLVTGEAMSRIPGGRATAELEGGAAFPEGLGDTPAGAEVPQPSAPEPGVSPEPMSAAAPETTPRLGASDPSATAPAPELLSPSLVTEPPAPPPSAAPPATAAAEHATPKSVAAGVPPDSAQTGPGPIESLPAPARPRVGPKASRIPEPLRSAGRKVALMVRMTTAGMGDRAVAPALAGGENAPYLMRVGQTPDIEPVSPSGTLTPSPSAAPTAIPESAVTTEASSATPPSVAEPTATPTGADAAPASPAAQSGRAAASEESFGDAEFDALVRNVRNSELGYRLEAGKRRPFAPLGEDTTRTRAQVDQAAHAAARANAPQGWVPGAQLQHQTKTLDVTRNLAPGTYPLDVNTINENTMYLQSRANLPSTLLHVDPQGGGTRIHIDDIPRGRVGDPGMAGEQLDLFKPSPAFNPARNSQQKLFRTEHKFADNYHIPAVSRQIARSRRNAGLPPLDPRMQAIAAGEQQRWMTEGTPGTTRSGEVVDIARNASVRPAEPTPPSAAPEPLPQLELPFGGPQPPQPSPPAPAAPEPSSPAPPMLEWSPPAPAPQPPASPAPEPTPPSPDAPLPAPSRPPPEAAPPEPTDVPPAPGPSPPPSPETEPEPRGAGPAVPEPVSPATPPEPQGTGKPGSSTPEHAAGGGVLHGATQAAFKAAALVRAYDAFEEERRRSGTAKAALLAGKTYLENTNVYAGAMANYQAKRKDGQDKGEALVSTIGETIGGFLVPGKGVDQAINAAANLTDAVDDHLKRGDPNAEANAGKANPRTGADFATELTPSRMFSQTIGAGARAYWDIGKFAGGDAKGVDKFGDDTVKGKLGMVLQPWAMAADFAGNLGSGEGAGKALDKTMAKAKGSTLEKVGSKSGDLLYDLGQSEDAKAGKYGMPVQGIAMLLGATSDHIAGKSWGQSFENAAKAGKGSLADKIGSAGGDLAFAAQEEAVKAIDRVSQLKTQATDKWQELKDSAASYLPW